MRHLEKYGPVIRRRRELVKNITEQPVYLRQRCQIIYVMKGGDLIAGPAYTQALADSALAAPLAQTLPRMKQLLAPLPQWETA